MKVSSLLVWILLVAAADNIASAQSTFSKSYHNGSTLYVCAQAGLSLRSAADVKSTVLTVVKFGEPVVVISDKNPQVPFNTAGIEGAWVKVRYGKNEGYQFDGFLSRWSPPVADSNLDEYLKANFKMASIITQPPDSGLYNMYENIVFENGIEFLWSAPEGGNTISTSIPASLITYQEIYLLARQAFPLLSNCPYREESMRCETDDSSISIYRNDTNGSSRYIISWGQAD